MGQPVLDGFLVAFFGLALGALHAPAQPMSQQPPHRRVRQRHPGQALNHYGDAVQGPHIGGEPVGQRALQQRLLDRLQLVVGDLGAAAGRAAALQSRGP